MYVVDAHLDLAYTMEATGRDIAQEQEEHSLSLPGLREGGVGLFFATIFAAKEWEENYDGIASARQFEVYQKLLADHPTTLASVGSLADLALAREGGRTGFTILLEGADPLRTPGELADFHRRGVRFVGLAWNNRNMYASGINTKQGLTEAGNQLVDEMNRLNVPADLSHLNETSFWDVCDRTELVPFASHSNARAVTDIPRNLYDKQLETIAARGGIVGLNFYEGFLRRSGKKGRADRTDLIAHVDHIFDRVGAGVVGIGSDFDGGFGPDKCVEGFERPAHFEALAAFLAERGYSDEDVNGILGGNFLAYLERVWKEAE